MALKRELWITIFCAVAVLAAVAYLRDPPWLLQVTSGLSKWEAGDDGIRYRWTRGRASFFVPADASSAILTMRSVRHLPDDWPITATMTIDDRPVRVIMFHDEEWREVRLRMPPPGSRDVARIDITLDRARYGRGLQLQQVRWE